MAGLREVDSDLVSPAGFEAAFDDGVAVQSFDRLDMRHGALPQLAILRAPAPTVPAVGNEPRFDCLLANIPPRDGQIDAIDTVAAELQPEKPLGIDSAREDHQAARLAIDAVHG